MGFVNLHVGQFPNYRPRRLRQSAALRKLASEAAMEVLEARGKDALVDWLAEQGIGGDVRE